MSTKTIRVVRTAIDGPNAHRYPIPKDKDQAFAAWAVAVDKNDLETYVNNGDETFERYGFADYAYNYAVLKSTYAQVAY